MMSSSWETTTLYDMRSSVQIQASEGGHFISEGPGVLGRMTNQEQQDPGEVAALSGDQVTCGH